MAQLVEHDHDGYVTTHEDIVEKSLEVSYQQLALAISEVQQAQKKLIFQRVQETLRSQEHALELRVLASVEDKLSKHFKEMIQKVEGKIQKLEESVLERMQKLEEKVMDIEQRPRFIVDEDKYDLGVKVGINQAGNHRKNVASLAKESARALELLCTRVESLENQMHACTAPVTHSPLPATPTSDVPFISSSTFSPTNNFASPTATTSVHFSSKCSIERRASLLPSLESSTLSRNDISLAVRQGNVHALKLLLGGATLRLNDKEINELLHEAVKAGHDEAVSLLLNAGAECDTRNSDKETPLHVATLNNQPVIMSALLERDCDVNAKNCDGVTALHLATQADDSGHCVSLLLSKHADVTSKTVRGDTPLHWAAVHDNVAAVQTLLNAKASKKVKNSCGMIPWDLAETSLVRQLLHPGSRSKRRRSCVTFLNECGEKQFESV